MNIWPRFLTFPRGPDQEIGPADDVYLQRWRALPVNPIFNIYLHHFRRSDDDRALHDHPRLNLSIILTGAYFEHLADGSVKLRQAWRPWAPWRLIARRPSSLHRIELIQGGVPTWTLFFVGPRVREWGFACPQGWRHWTEFTSQTANGNQIGRGCD